MTTRTTHARASRRVRLLAALAVPVLLLSVSACNGGGSDAASKSPTAALAAAKKSLDKTSGVSLGLSTASLPRGVDGVLEATGVATHAPAFQGDLKVEVNSLTVDVPVVSVNGQVYAKLPFTTKFATVNPGDYGAPDPANLMDPAQGISSWLTSTKGVKQGGKVREGSKVLTSYSGTLSGRTIATAIPSADRKGVFTATYALDSSGRLAKADVKGPFYGPQGIVDYTITVSGYGTKRNVTKP